jgi:hyperosmotically inducible protein
MNTRTTLAAAITALVLVTAAGCAVQRGQQTVGAYVDDSAITATVKAKFAESKAVDSSSVTVETLNGTVMLSGFAKSETERETAATIAKSVDGVKAVKNQLVVAK